MQNSKIEWTDHTFNPWWGCQRVSPGCESCYAETLAKRYGHAVWGPAKTTGRRTMSENYWRQPLRWNEAARKVGQRARVFCASMADVFEDHPQVADWRMRLFELIDSTPMLDWLLLTKRPENVMPMMADWLEGTAFPSNIIMMTSVENQEYADRRIPELLKIPATRRGLSCEPLLGPLDLSAYLATCEWCGGSLYGDHECYDPAGIDWLIVGGESGHGARPMHPDWARALRDQCQAAGIAFFFKQWGEWLPMVCERDEERVGQFVGADGRRIYLSDLLAHAHEIKDDRGIIRLGKKVAGRLLDGREWDEVPT